MAICLECEKEYTPSSQGFMSAAGVHPELCPECAAAAVMVACKECGRKFTPPKRRPLFAGSDKTEICPECVEAAEAAFSRLMVEATPRVTGCRTCSILLAISPNKELITSLTKLFGDYLNQNSRDWYSTARVSKRPSHKVNRLLTRAVLYRRPKQLS